MSDDDVSTTPETDAGVACAPRRGPPVPGLVVIHSPRDAAHAGSWLPVPSALGSAPLVLGRGAEGEGTERAWFVRQRPGEGLPLPPLGNRALSRSQLELRHTPLGIEAVNVGRVPLAVNGIVTSRATLSPGDVIELGHQLVLLVCERPARLEGPSPDPRHVFGGPDAFGMVGESPKTWQLRGELASAARQSGHVLVLGPSGSGKELAAAAIHGLFGQRAALRRA